MTNNVDPQPGVREAHLLRKKDNPLFDAPAREITNEALAEARLKDSLEMDQFMQDFQALVRRAVAFKPDEPSDSVLELKEELDRCYQRACGLPGDQAEVKTAIRKLVAAIMQAVRSGIGNDAYAARQLDEEDLARQTHFELQELPLVAALTHSDSPIAENELVPSLLSEDDDNLSRSLMLFDEGQLAAICHAAERLLSDIDPDKKIADAWRRLDIIRDYYRNIIPASNAKRE